MAAIRVDSSSASPYEASLSTYGWSHTNNGNFLVVGVSIFATGTVSSITYNSVPLTKIRADDGGIYRSELWYLANPSFGANTVTVNLSASLTSIAGAVSYFNISLIGPLGAQSGATGTNNPATVNLTTTADNTRVVSTAATQTTSITVGAGNTQRWNTSGTLGSGVGSDQQASTLATITMQWTGLGVTDSWAISAVELRAAANESIYSGGSIQAPTVKVINQILNY